jgi:cobalt/nickel transport system ATP-binding protein
MAVILAAQGLHYAYPGGGGAALAGLDLDIRKGRRLAILGANGAGKTTVLLHLNGTLVPSAGQVRLDGAAAGYGRAERSAWRRRVGLVLQDPDDQLFAASVAEDVSFGPLNLGLDPAMVGERVAWALESLRIADLADRPPHLLSFGQKKRVAIAGAVAMRPEILLLDEPSAGLDPFGTTHLLAVLERLQEGGATLVFTTHDVDLAWGWADDVAVFAAGRVAVQGEAEQVLADGGALAAAHLKPPFLLQLGLRARELGLLGPEDPLPRRHRDGLALLDRLKS